MTRLQKWKLFWLKRRLRRLWQSMDAQLDSVSCGANVLSFIRPSFGKQQDDFRKLWKDLQALDPDAPPCPV